MESIAIMAEIIGHKLEIGESQAAYMVDAIRRWQDGPVTVTIKKERAAKSVLQMGYYYGLILPMLVEEMCGTPDDPECTRMAHLRLKAMFLPQTAVDWVDPETGEEVHREVVPSLADLNSKEMTDFVDRVRQWALEFFGMIIPEPDKEWKMRRKGTHGEEAQV